MAREDANAQEGLEEVAQQARANPLNILGKVTGGEGGTFHNSTDMGLLFLALVNKQDPKYNEVDPNAPQGSDDSVREVGARAAFERWETAAERRLVAEGRPNGPSDVRAEVIAELKEQLVQINGGAELTASANAQIDAMMGGNGQSFADDIVENSDLYARKLEEHKAAQIAARQADPNAQPQAMGFVGIMAELMRSEGDEPKASLNTGDISDVGISAEEQVSMNMSSAYQGLNFFMNAPGGGEKGLAQIAGVRWGKFTEDNFKENSMTYEGINPMDGLGALGGDDYLRAVEAFISPEGLGSIREHEYYQNYQLTGDSSQGGAVNLQNLVITPMEENGLIAFASDEARQDFVAHMGGGLMRGLSAAKMEARMDDFAAARSDITLATETNPEAGVTAADINLAEAQRIQEQQNQAKAQGGQQNQGQQDGAPVEVQAEAEPDNEDLVASLEVGAQYPIVEGVINYDAVRAEGDMRMPTVPVVTAGLDQQLQTQTPMPVEMGYGVQQNAQAVNSPFEPNMDIAPKSA